MADHEPGSMDTKEHEKMFASFMTFTTRTVIVIIAILVIMAIFFR
jgi:heme/copper-type cytochrome/quinol oxidase subunit 2